MLLDPLTMSKHRHCSLRCKPGIGAKPPLSSTVTVRLFVLDLNDNAPAVLRLGLGLFLMSLPLLSVSWCWPPSHKGDRAGLGLRLQCRGFVLLLEAPDPSLFAVSRYAGEVRISCSHPS